MPVTNLNYVAYSGGGESLAALLGNKVSAGISGVNEYAEQVQAGKLRALAVSGAQRVPGVDAPTLKEAGLAVELSNWRGIVGPPKLHDDAKKRLTALVDQLHASPAWKAAAGPQRLDRHVPVRSAVRGVPEPGADAGRGVLADLGLVS